MHRGYVDKNTVQDTELYYFDANTYDKDYDFIINSCVSHDATLQYHKHNIL